MSVTIYTQPGCTPCSRTKALFDTYNIDYTEVNVREDEEALARLKELGVTKTPFVEIPGYDSWMDYNPGKIVDYAEES